MSVEGETPQEPLGMSPARAWALALGGVVLTWLGILLFTPRDEWLGYIVYDVPIAVPFVFFLLERRAAWAQERRGRHGLDGAVLATALFRPLSLALWQMPLPPFVSGHALFLTYALGTARSSTLRWSALLVWLQVLVMKIVWWGDLSFLGGLVVGVACSVVWHRWQGSPGDVRAGIRTDGR